MHVAQVRHRPVEGLLQAHRGGWRGLLLEQNPAEARQVLLRGTDGLHDEQKVPEAAAGQQHEPTGTSSGSMIMQLAAYACARDPRDPISLVL